MTTERERNEERIEAPEIQDPADACIPVDCCGTGEICLKLEYVKPELDETEECLDDNGKLTFDCGTDPAPICFDTLQQNDQSIALSADCPGDGKLTFKHCDAVKFDPLYNDYCGETRENPDTFTELVYTANQNHTLHFALCVDWMDFPVCDDGLIVSDPNCVPGGGWTIDLDKLLDGIAGELPICDGGGLVKEGDCFAVDWSSLPICDDLSWKGDCKDYGGDADQHACDGFEVFSVSAVAACTNTVHFVNVNDSNDRFRFSGNALGNYERSFGKTATTYRLEWETPFCPDGNPGQIWTRCDEKTIYCEDQGGLSDNDNDFDDLIVTAKYGTFRKDGDPNNVTAPVLYTTGTNPCGNCEKCDGGTCKPCDTGQGCVDGKCVNCQSHEEQLCVTDECCSKPEPPAECDGSYCGGGDKFVVEKPDATCNNFIIFTNVNDPSDRFEYAAKKTGTYDMNFTDANLRYRISFDTDNCKPDEDDDWKPLIRLGDKKNCQGQGKKLYLEDYGNQKPDKWDFTDLIINTQEGMFTKDGSTDVEADCYYVTGSNSKESCSQGCSCQEGQCKPTASRSSWSAGETDEELAAELASLRVEPQTTKRGCRRCGGGRSPEVRSDLAKTGGKVVSTNAIGSRSRGDQWGRWSGGVLVAGSIDLHVLPEGGNLLISLPPAAFVLTSNDELETPRFTHTRYGVVIYDIAGRDFSFVSRH